MVYTPGGQKWRPTCTGSEVCMSMWTSFPPSRDPSRGCNSPRGVRWGDSSARLGLMATRGRGFANTGALTWSRRAIISKYLGSKMGQASRLSWPQQLAASLLNGLAHNVNIFPLVGTFLCFSVFLPTSTGESGNRAAAWLLRRACVFKTVVWMLPRRVWGCLCICLLWHAAISTIPNLANVSTSSGSTDYHDRSPGTSFHPVFSLASRDFSHVTRFVSPHRSPTSTASASN